MVTEGTSTGAPRPMRADARRNQENLLSVAVAEFSRTGVDAPLETIAKKAGVGIGTLYRHFPSREALVVAAYRHEVSQLCAAAPDLLATMPPDAALAEWMARFVGYVAAKRGMAEALRPVVAADAALYASTHDQIVTALASLLAAGAAAGTIRADADAEDVLRAMSGVWLASAEQGWQDQAQRLLRLLMDGLRYGAPAPSSSALSPPAPVASSARRH